MRNLVVLLGCLLLGACNIVMTKDPVFPPGDAAGHPHLKSGVWAPAADKDCAFDTTTPLASWPACANGFVIKGDVMGAFSHPATNDGAAKQPTWQEQPYVLARGDPRVFQLRMTAGDSEVLPLPVLYIYAAVKPTDHDADGDITGFTSWIVLCGPPPPKGTKSPDGSMDRGGTLQPLPGLTMDGSGNDCMTDKPDALRGAAGASLQWSKDTDISHVHWLREGDK